MKILRLTDVGEESAVREAARVLEEGGIILYPTDTLYGLGVDASNLKALAKLRELKGREKKKPVSVVVADLESLEAHAVLETEARALAERHLPGALTLVLPSSGTLPEEVLLNGAIGLRIPDDSFTLSLARTFGKPYTATSANKSGEVTRTNAQEILVHFGPSMQHIDLVIDDGERASELPSTVVAFIEGKPRILREGSIGRAQIESPDQNL